MFAIITFILSGPESFFAGPCWNFESGYVSGPICVDLFLVGFMNGPGIWKWERFCFIHVSPNMFLSQWREYILGNTKHSPKKISVTKHVRKKNDTDHIP